MLPTHVEATLSTAAAAALAALSCAVLGACSAPASPSPPGSPSPSAVASTASAAADTVTLHGVSVTLPPAVPGLAAGGKVVTFQGDCVETSFLVALAPCDQVTSGTGAASHAGPALYAALAKVPLTALR